MAAWLLIAATSAVAAEQVRYRSLVSGPSGLPDACGRAAIESTPQLAVDPRDPRRLGGVYLFQGAETVVGIRSGDGGRTWRRIPVTDAARCSGGPREREYVVNPYVAVAPGGDTWFGNSWAGRAGLFAYNVLSHRLPAGASGWERAVALDPGEHAQDAAVLADAERPEVATYVWNRFVQVPNPFTYAPPDDQLMTATTTDGGRSFTRPALLADDPPYDFHDNPSIVRTGPRSLVVTVSRFVVADLVTLFTAPVTGPVDVRVRMDALHSADGGRTWRGAHGVANRDLFDIRDPERSATPAPVNGLTDTASGGDGSVAIVNVPRGRTIELVRSPDGGRTWLPPTSTVRLASQPMLASVAVRPDGQLGLLYYDFRSDRPGDGAWSFDAWFAASSDGGRTWEEAHVAGPMDLRDAAEPGVAYDGGPLGVYQDLVALPDGFGAIFTVTRPVARDGRTDVMFARLGSRRLRIEASPRTLRANRTRRLRVRVTDAARRPLEGARVRLGRRSARTGPDGRARLRVRLARSGVHRLVVTHEERRTRKSVRVR